MHTNFVSFACIWIKKIWIFSKHLKIPLFACKYFIWGLRMDLKHEMYTFLVGNYFSMEVWGFQKSRFSLLSESQEANFYARDFIIAIGL